ncbi:MAG: TetR/AcrR family transcriptional regulator [Actinomycetota bacterium]
MEAAHAEDPRVARSKAAILEATLELLAENGVAATTIEAISDRSGVAKTTIYRHWPGKPELVIAAYESLTQAGKDPDTGSIAGDLEALAFGLTKALASGRFASLLPTLIDAAERDPEMSKLHHRFAADREAVVHRIVAKARSRGEIRDDLADGEVVDLIAGPIFYRRLVAHDRLDPSSAKRLAALVSEIVAPDQKD